MHHSFYTPLSPQNREIRLLTLYPGLPGSPISCSLEPASLDDDPAYTALSYSWGNSPERERIILSGEQVDAGRNLGDALFSLRDEIEERVYWIDALCINQNDDEEKGSQVQLMRDIYRGAKQTILWLGVEADGSDIAMDIISNLDDGGPDSAKNQLTPEGLSPIVHLYKRNWWRRVWIIQEAVLSVNPVFRCGAKQVPLHAFIRMHLLRTSFGSASSESQRQHLNLIRATPFESILGDLETWRTWSPKDQTRLATRVQLAWDFEATDPRDKIYALLGLCSESDTSAIKPDYSISVAELYTAVTRHFITKTKDLTPLQYSDGNQDLKHGLPSWVPDYSDTRARDHAWFIGDSYFAVGASSQEIITHPFSTSWREFKPKGLLVDTITYIGPNPPHDYYIGTSPSERLSNNNVRRQSTISNANAWETKALSSASGTDIYPQIPTQTKAEAFWRCLMADRMPFYYPNQQLMLPHPNPFFEVWMGRASTPSEFSLANAGMSSEELARLYTKPVNDAVVPRCHGRTFILTAKGMMGLAPLRTKVGDVVTVLEGGYVPFVLRPRVQNERGGDGEGSENRTFEFVGEAYVHGIMNGEVVTAAKEESMRMFIIE